MGVKYDVVTVRTDEKTDKKYYTNIGRVIETDKGLSIKLDVIPIGWNGWASFYTPKAKEEKTEKTESTGTKALQEMDDDLPF